MGRGGAKVLEMVQNQTFEILMTRSKIQDPMWFTCDVGDVENSPQGGEEPGIGGADLEKEDLCDLLVLMMERVGLIRSR